MRLLLALRTLNAELRRRFLVPAKRWLTVQHTAALFMILYALSMFMGAPVAVALAHVVHFDALPTVAGIIFVLCAILLFGAQMPERDYQLAILPMLGYALVVLWHVATSQPPPRAGQALTWGTVIGAGLIWLAFGVAGVQLPEGSEAPSEGLGNDRPA